MNRFVVISGCSGGGKSTLLAELARRGHAVVEEPGRRIVAEETRTGGSALPWVDAAAFARRAVAMALADRAAARDTERVGLFRPRPDRCGLGLEEVTGEPVLRPLAEAHRYHDLVFMTPPWPEIYTTDAERRHDLAAGVAEYDRLLRVYPDLGYEMDVLPKVSVAERADYVLARLASPEPG